MTLSCRSRLADDEHLFRYWLLPVHRSNSHSKQIRAVVTRTHLDDVIARTNIVVAEPWHSKDRKRLGSSYPIIVQRIPKQPYEPMPNMPNQGDIIQVIVGKRIFAIGATLHHIGYYRKTVREADPNPSYLGMRINLLRAYNAVS